MHKSSFHAVVRAEISRHLTAAIKGRDVAAINALRAALSALDNATAVPLAEARPPQFGARVEVAGRELTRADIEALLLAEAGERSAAATEYERLGDPDRARRLEQEAGIVRGTLERLASVETGGER